MGMKVRPRLSKLVYWSVERKCMLYTMLYYRLTEKISGQRMHGWNRRSARSDEQILAELLNRMPPGRDDMTNEQALAALLKHMPPGDTDEQALAMLLTRVPPAASATHPRPVYLRPVARQRPHYHHVIAVLLIVLVLGGGYVLGRAIFAANTIRRDVQAMQLPTPATALPTVTVPAASVIPTATVSDNTISGGPAKFAPVDNTAARQPPGAAFTPVATATATVVPTLTPLPTDARVPPQELPAIGPTHTAVPAGRVPAAVPVPVGAASIPAELDPEAVTVLLLGIDRRPGETFPARADAIMVARLEPQQGRIALLSLNRDLVVDIPGYGSGRINAANVHGEMYYGAGGGPELMRQTVSNLLDVPIDYVIQVNFQGFIGAVDAIGGITIDVEQELYDSRYPTMDYGYTVAHFKPGPQHMDGARALMYSRIRHMDSDFARIRRQQEVLVAVLERLREQHALGQLEQVAALTTALRDYIKTDMPPERIVTLAWAFREVSPGSIEHYSVDASMVSMYVLPGDPYAAFALPGTIESLSYQLMEGSQP